MKRPLYNDYSSYLREKYGCKVHRIGLDAGFSCPNRDGTKGIGGCIYCDGAGSRSPYTDPSDTVGIQLKKRMEYLKTTKAAKKFIAYFQAFTNTYAPADTVKRVYDEVLSFEDVVGMTIGTRPDAVDREKLAVISSYKGRYEVWLEYGLQSIHDRTLEAIKRAHTYKDFTDAVSMTRQFGIPICAHIILGLPGESREEMIATAKALTHLKINGVKIHLLHVLKGTVLERLYLNGKVALLEENEYAELVCDFLENLSPDIIIQRLTGEGNTLNHVAPSWAHNKLGTINRIKAILRKRGSWQGYRLAKA